MDPVTGRMGDSDQIRTTGVLEDQQQFAKNDTSSEDHEPFLNIFDKGFRNVLDARRCGQRCLQPVFARSDEQFTRDETLHSACVAQITRSGNERAVRLTKKSRFITHRNNDTPWDVELVCDEWLGWTFQINFMYDQYL